MIVTSALLGVCHIFISPQFEALSRGFKETVGDDASWLAVRPEVELSCLCASPDNNQVSKSMDDCGAIALSLADSSIKEVTDFWSDATLEFDIDEPCPATIDQGRIKEIVFRSIKYYLGRPGHVQLDNGMIHPDDIQRAKGDQLLRARLLLRYWYGSQDLPYPRFFTVSGVSPEFLFTAASHHRSAHVRSNSISLASLPISRSEMLR